MKQNFFLFNYRRILIFIVVVTGHPLLAIALSEVNIGFIMINGLTHT